MAVCLEHNGNVRFFEIVKNWIRVECCSGISDLLAVRKLIVLHGIWLLTQQYLSFLFLLVDTTLMVYS